MLRAWAVGKRHKRGRRGLRIPGPPRVARDVSSTPGTKAEHCGPAGVFDAPSMGAHGAETVAAGSAVAVALRCFIGDSDSVVVGQLPAEPARDAEQRQRHGGDDDLGGGRRVAVGDFSGP